MEELSQGKAYVRDARTKKPAVENAILAAPLTTAGQITGWLALTAGPSHAFSAEDIALARLVAEIVAIGRGRALTDRALARAKEEAVAASQTKSAFLANMSHELRTPLNGVIGMVDLLARTTLDERQKRFAQVAKSSASLLLSVINDILDFSKIEAGKLDMDEADFTVGDLVEQVASIFEAPAEQKGIDLCCECTGFDGALVGAEARIRQVLVNLVSNAVKFTATGEVVVHAKSEPKDDGVHVRFEVRDTGIGMSLDAQASLFQPFHQVDASSTRVHGGSGLGLAISRGLVGRMGGHIGVESEVGRGSTFWVVLRLPPSATTRVPESSLGSSLAGVRVLAVDDNATNREILVTHLSAAGMECETFNDGPSALRALKLRADAKTPYALALIDHHMPGMDGVELVRRIRSDSSIAAVHVIMLGSAIVPVEPAIQQKLGIAHYGTKPIWRGQLLRVIAAVLAGTVVEPAPPISEPPKSAAPSPPPPPRTGSRILLVEDSAINAEVAGEILRSAGYAYDLVTDGREAVDSVKQRPYALVLMDCQLPEVDGYEASRQIRDLERKGERKGPEGRLPIVALTASVQREDLERCIQAGMDAHIAKPFDARHLLAMIASRLEAVESPNPPAAAAEEARTERVDLVRALERLSGNRDLLVRIVRQFVGIAAETRRALRADVEAKNAAKLAFATHRLRGQAASFDAHALVSEVRELESLVERGEWPAATDQLVRVDSEIEELCSALSAFADAG
jgi:signal transduction histidine kinase/DNA-binding response OmpR family regulator